MTRVELSEAARADLVQHFVYLAEEASEAVADRFLVGVETSFKLLATQPLIGPVIPTRLPELVGTRKWRVKEFDRFLIFYLPLPDGIRVVRLLHTAQDWWRLLDLPE